MKMSQVPYQPMPSSNHVTIVNQPPPMAPDQFLKSGLSQMKVLSILQVVMGVTCLIFGIVFMALDTSYSPGHYVGLHGYGMWIGGYFIIVGGIGLGAVRANTSGWITSSMILNILCSVFFCCTLAGYTSAGLIETSIFKCQTFFGVGWSEDDSLCDLPLVNAYYAMDSMMMIMSLIEFIITIWCAALCCGAVCDCCKTTMIPQQQVITTYPIGQTTIQPANPLGVSQVSVGVHQATPYGGYASQPVYLQPLRPPAYTVQTSTRHIQMY